MFYTYYREHVLCVSSTAPCVWRTELIFIENMFYAQHNLPGEHILHRHTQTHGAERERGRQTDGAEREREREREIDHET